MKISRTTTSSTSTSSTSASGASSVTKSNLGSMQVEIHTSNPGKPSVSTHSTTSSSTRSTGAQHDQMEVRLDSGQLLTVTPSSVQVDGVIKANLTAGIAQLRIEVVGNAGKIFADDTLLATF